MKWSLGTLECLAPRPFVIARRDIGRSILHTPVCVTLFSTSETCTRSCQTVSSAISRVRRLWYCFLHALRSRDFNRMPRTCALVSPPTKCFTCLCKHCPQLRLPLSPSDPISTICCCVLASRAVDPASFSWALCHGSDYKEELSFAMRNVALVLEVIGCARIVGRGDARPMEKTASGCSTLRLRWRRCAFLSHNPTNTSEHFSFYRGCVMDHSASSSLARLTQKRASTHHYHLC